MANQTTLSSFPTKNKLGSDPRLSDSCNSVAGVVDWLGSTKNVNGNQLNGDCNQQRHQVADYENCLSLQQHLQGARCRSVGNLPTTDLLEASDDSNNDAEEDQAHLPVSLAPSSPAPACLSSPQNNTELETYDADYAASSEENSLSARSSSVELHSLQADTMTPAKFDDNPATRRTKCKEIMLMVVINENEHATSGDEVFYINPSVSYVLTFIHVKKNNYHNKLFDVNLSYILRLSILIISINHIPIKFRSSQRSQRQKEDDLRKLKRRRSQMRNYVQV